MIDLSSSLCVHRNPVDIDDENKNIFILTTQEMLNSTGYFLIIILSAVSLRIKKKW